jgi:hypothetical protein
VISWPRTKETINMLCPHGKTEMLVTWTQMMKSLLMGNVYNLCRM